MLTCNMPIRPCAEGSTERESCKLERTGIWEAILAILWELQTQLRAATEQRILDLKRTKPNARLFPPLPPPGLRHSRVLGRSTADRVILPPGGKTWVQFLFPEAPRPASSLPLQLGKYFRTENLPLKVQQILYGPIPDPSRLPWSPASHTEHGRQVGAQVMSLGYEPHRLGPAPSRTPRRALGVTEAQPPHLHNGDNIGPNSEGLWRLEGWPRKITMPDFQLRARGKLAELKVWVFLWANMTSLPPIQTVTGHASLFPLAAGAQSQIRDSPVYFSRASWLNLHFSWYWNFTLDLFLVFTSLYFS